MKKAVLDLTGCTDLFDMHKRIRVSLDFSDHYGEKDDIAEITIDENDLIFLTNGMDARINERIKARWESK